MRASARRFPYEKAVILNVLYDALDAMDFTIDKSDSMRGMLLVSLKAAKAVADEKMRIVISPSLREETSLVEIFPANGKLENHELISVLFDEMDALIQRAGIEAIK